MYAAMKFPQYKFEEFPKWVTRYNGDRVVVNNQAEELRIVAEIPEARPLTELEGKLLDAERDRDEVAKALDKSQGEAATLQRQVAALMERLTTLEAKSGPQPGDTMVPAAPAVAPPPVPPAEAKPAAKK